MNNNIDGYVWCDDELSLRNVTDAIKLCSEVVLDCEGDDLGREGGSLSLISFRTIGPEIPKTYLIDVLSLSDDALRPVFDIIQSPSPTKIMFDGRMDYAELFHGHGVPIRGALDLQLADISSRSQRGEDEEDQLRRLSPYLKRGEVSGQRGSYTQVQKLCGLQQCLLEHGIHSRIEDDHVQVTHSFWLRRPLPEVYLRYAARDVYFIGLLYNDFKDEGFITSQLPAQSDRYVSIWQDAKPTDEYRSHALLPLQILDHISYGPVLSCICCNRSLPRAAYSNTAWAKPKQRRCWVCRAIYIKFKVQARSYDYSDDSDGGLFGGYYGSDSDVGGYWSDDYGGYSS